MATTQATTDGISTATGTSVAATATLSSAATPVLGKRKDRPHEDPPASSMLSSSSSSSSSTASANAVVDAAFRRLFGYSWGTTFDLPTSKSNHRGGAAVSSSRLERQMIRIFGPTRTARILNLSWDVVAPVVSAGSETTPSTGVSHNNIAAALTTKIVATPNDSTVSATTAAAAVLRVTDSATGSRKRTRLEEKDYKNIALPGHMVSTKDKTPEATPAGPSSSSSAAAAASTATNQQPLPGVVAAASAAVATVPASNLDSVLSQIAGKKQLNTVEKSSNDWEGFKETDKNLQDELERNAQSKNAFLVKQDFLDRVDHRKFELEKAERDRERSRRATEGS